MPLTASSSHKSSPSRLPEDYRHSHLVSIQPRLGIPQVELNIAQIIIQAPTTFGSSLERLAQLTAVTKTMSNFALTDFTHSEGPQRIRWRIWAAGGVSYTVCMLAAPPTLSFDPFIFPCPNKFYDIFRLASVQLTISQAFCAKLANSNAR